MTKRTYYRIRRHLLLSVGLLAGFAISSQAQSTKLYKWVDSKGNISYQDRPPPKDAKILEEREIEPPAATSTVVDGVPIVVYTVPECQRCVEVLSWLTARGLPTQELSLQDDRDAQAQILNLNNGLTAPALFIDEQFVFDTSEESMLTALEDAGYTFTLPDAIDNADSDSGEDSVNSDGTQSSETSAVPGSEATAVDDDDEGSLFDENFNEIVEPEEDLNDEDLEDEDLESLEFEDENPDEASTDESSDLVE